MGVHSIIFIILLSTGHELACEADSRLFLHFIILRVFLLSSLDNKALLSL